MIRRVLRRFAAWRAERRRPDPDGFGQSLADDIRYLRRSRAMRREAIAWRLPTSAEATRWDTHPVVSRFGDMTYAIATHAGRTCVVRENDWHGWPDPPRFALFAMDGDEIWAGADMGSWPRAWRPDPREPEGGAT